MTCISTMHWLTLAAVLTVLAACSNGAPASTASAAASPPMSESAQRQGRVLTYYIDQTGQNPDDITALFQYTAELKGCEHSGGSVTPLSAADVAKLGVWRVRVWQRPGEHVRQIDTWSPVASTQGEPGPFKVPCNFRGLQQHSVREILIPPHDAYKLDLIKRTGIYSNDNNLSLTQPHMAASSNIGAGSGGLEVLKIKKLGRSEALGQPCDLWSGGMAMGVTKDGMSTSGGKYEECDWSGGAKWGFGDGPGGPIVLWRKMATDVPQSPGWVKTAAFDVGHLPTGSDKVFEIPKDITLRSRTAGVAAPGNAK